ncbi:hypothetical protein [Arthrobacter sp. E3]|uniref:hypothetical protein n=1 Tax=Arthrobacter sp. E3 TaxID=517402 RepID=UPI001A9424F2|nr:hypothetical protein [Arthrobacter sp. E3]
MKTKLSISAAVAVAAAIALGGCSAGLGATSEMNHPAPVASSAATAHTEGAMASMIHIQEGKFLDPKPLDAGTSVSVMNMGTTAATIVSDQASAFSVTVPAGGMAAFKAPAKPGSYPYHSMEGDMHGVLTVVAGPAPEAAAMVCAAEARNTVKDILALPAVPEPETEWDGTTYTCTYPLAAGNFVMSVTVAETPEKATEAAQKLAASLSAAPIKGLANLGLPGYQSQAGNVIFAKDNMTLHVDATALPASVGPHDVSAASFAYEMSTTILGCWTHG